MRGLTTSSEVSPLDVWDDLPSDTFVGRNAELRSLTKLLAGTRSRTASAVVEGEAGIGKTRLVGEFLERSLHKGFRALQGCCYQVQETGPYFPLLQILSQFHLSGSASEEVLQSLGAEALGHGEWTRLSQDIRGKRAAFLRALSEAILRGAASEETVLCIEDIQWADIGTLLVLNNLLDMRSTGLLIVCTVRTDEPAEAEARQLLSRIEQKGRRIVLRGLTRAEVREFVGNVAGQGYLSEEETQTLHSFTKGNPFFLRELVLHLKESCLLDRHTVQEATMRSRLPDRLTHIIDMRLRSLPNEVYGALSAASVIGTQFSADLVAQVIGVRPLVAEARLERGVVKQVLQPLDALETSRFKFTHPLFAMRLYEMLPSRRRRDLHRRVAEAATSCTTLLTVDELARHHALGFGTAGGRAAVDYCREAAEQAERVLAYETAARFWELALRCTKPQSRRAKADLYRRLGWAFWAASKWTKAAEAWGEAVRLFESLKDWRHAGELALALGDMHRWRQELVESERWLERALELAQDSSADRARALALLGSIRCLGKEPSQGLRLLEEASQLISTSGGDPLVLYWLSYGFLTTGDPSRAYAIAREGLEEAQQMGRSNAVALLAGSLVYHELSRLRAKSARSYIQIVEHWVDPTDTTGLTRLLICKALFAGYAGKWNRVVRLCERWMSQVRLAGPYHVANARFHLGEAKLALGDASAACGHMLRALPDLGEMRSVAAVHLARALIGLGRDAEALGLLRQYSRQLAKSPRSTAAAGRAMLGQAASSLNEPNLWQLCYDSLRPESRPIVLAYCPISVQRVLGRLAGRLKLWSAAIEHFDTALEQLAAGAARWELTQTYLDYAEMRRARRHRGDARKAAGLELEARGIVEGLGIQHSALRRLPMPSTDGGRFALTGRELEVLALVAEGRRNPEIAVALTISGGTVERHLENIFVKMGVKTRTEAVVEAVREGLLGPLARPARTAGSEATIPLPG